MVIPDPIVFTRRYEVVAYQVKDGDMVLEEKVQTVEVKEEVSLDHEGNCIMHEYNPKVISEKMVIYV